MTSLRLRLKELNDNPYIYRLQEPNHRRKRIEDSGCADGRERQRADRCYRMEQSKEL